MDFIFIANAWSMGKDNPTSKHRIALELVRRGHRVLWIEGSGMRTPNLGSGTDRLRMVRKLVAALRGVRRETIDRKEETVDRKEETIDHRPKTIDQNLNPLPLHLRQGYGGHEGERKGQCESPSVSKSDVYGLRSKVFSPPSLWVISPLFIPLPKLEFIRQLNGLICRLCMRFWGWWLGFRDPVLINYVPVLAEAMRCRRRRQVNGYRLSVIGNTDNKEQITKNRSSGTPNNQQLITNNPPRASRVVYHCVDRWDAFSTYDATMMAEMDKRCCQYADLVIASSQDLVERCQRYNPNVHLVSHGVDHAHFAQALQVTQRPADLPPGRIAGFFGLLSEWLDQDLLIEVAKRVPECEIVLIGKADVPIERLKGIRNIHCLGPRPFNQLPAYVAHFDVGLIPFVINELTVAVNPIKLREMLAAGCPVVSTDLPEVRAYQNRGVEVASTAESFTAAVAERIRNPATPVERAQISAGVANETWSVKVDEILRCL